MLLVADPNVFFLQQVMQISGRERGEGGFHREESGEENGRLRVRVEVGGVWGWGEEPRVPTITVTHCLCHRRRRLACV